MQVCSQLKSLLDDDNDMWGMHLTAKEAQRAAVQEAAARMMAEVNAMGGHPALGARRLEKVRVSLCICVVLVFLFVFGCACTCSSAMACFVDEQE